MEHSHKCVFYNTTSMFSEVCLNDEFEISCKNLKGKESQRTGICITEKAKFIQVAMATVVESQGATLGR